MRPLASIFGVYVPSSNGGNPAIMLPACIASSSDNGVVSTL